MAFANTVVRESAEVAVLDVAATADADVGPHNVPHGLASIPLDVSIVPLQVEAYTSAWIVSGITATNIALTKANAVGSGVAGAQIRVVARLDAYRDR